MPNFNKIQAPDGTAYTVEDTAARTAVAGKNILSMSYESNNKAVVFTSTPIEVADTAVTLTARQAAGLKE